MADEFDWLEGEAPKKSAAVTKPRSKKEGKPKELVLAGRRLPWKKRRYAELVLECDSIHAANKAFREEVEYVGTATLAKWRKDKQFAVFKTLLHDYTFELAGINKAKLMLDAEKVKQIALTPRVKFDKNGVPVGEEQELNIAMRALEFQGKGVGINDSEGAKVLVNIDIDFSGRADKAEATVIEGEVV